MRMASFVFLSFSFSAAFSFHRKEKAAKEKSS